MLLNILNLSDLAEKYKRIRCTTVDEKGGKDVRTKRSMGVLMSLKGWSSLLNSSHT